MNGQRKKANLTQRIRYKIYYGGGGGIPPVKTDKILQLRLPEHHQYLAQWNKEKREVGTNIEEVK